TACEAKSATHEWNNNKCKKLKIKKAFYVDINNKCSRVGQSLDANPGLVVFDTKKQCKDSLKVAADPSMKYYISGKRCKTAKGDKASRMVAGGQQVYSDLNSCQTAMNSGDAKDLNEKITAYKLTRNGCKVGSA